MDKTCDILVLGGGGAGLTAAVRAASVSDKKVIVLEKADFLGGGAAQAADFRVYGSRWQRERGFDDKLNEDLVKVMDETYWKLDPELVGRTFLATGKFFDWVCTFGEDVADHFEAGRYIFDMPDKGPVVPVYKEGLPGRSGGYIMRIMAAQAEKLGVEVLKNTRAADFRVENGKIVSVLADGPDGRLEIACGAVILATGSWINNQRELERVSPKYAAIDPGPLQKGGHRSRAYTGDGLALAEKAGAFIDRDSFCLRLMGPMIMSRCKTVSGMSGHRFQLQINMNGKRWCCEPSSKRMGIFDSGHVLCEQPEGVSWLVFDKNTVLAAAQDVKNAPPEGWGGIFGNPSFPEDVLADLENELNAPVGGSTVVPGGVAAASGLICAATVAELAEKMGVPALALEKTIADYNRACETGFDADCFKAPDALVPLTGPYYAYKGFLGTDGAFGGVLVNADMQAYAENGGLVEGLYVTGDFASGRFVNDMGVKRQIINDLAWAYASGYIAAESAVSYLTARG